MSVLIYGRSLMAVGRLVAALRLEETEREQLLGIANARSLPTVSCAARRLFSPAPTGESNASIAQRMRLGNATIGKWCQWYLRHGIKGLHDKLRRGRPRSHDDERVYEMINIELRSEPPDPTHWSVRSMAEHSRVSKSTVQRCFDLFGVQPHRQRHFKPSNDPFFIKKVRDIVGLYLNPPDHAEVLCVDEKSRTQVLERTQPLPPMGLGYVEGV